MNTNGLTLNTNLLSPEVVSNLPIRTQWALKRDGSETIKNTMLAVMHEQGRATLTNTALENLGALSALEEHLRQVVPSGAARYKHIVDAYALGAAQKIARW
jgi:hypothetical protein